MVTFDWNFIVKHKSWKTGPEIKLYVNTKLFLNLFTKREGNQQDLAGVTIQFSLMELSLIRPALTCLNNCCNRFGNYGTTGDHLSVSINLTPTPTTAGGF